MSYHRRKPLNKSLFIDWLPQVRDDADYLLQFEEISCEISKLKQDIGIVEQKLRTLLPKIYINSVSAFRLLGIFRGIDLIKLERQFKLDPKTFGRLTLLTKLQWRFLNIMKYESKSLKNAYAHMREWRMLCEELQNKRVVLDALGGPYK